MKKPEIPNLSEKKLSMLQESFQAVLGQKDLFANIIDFFPYPIEVFARDGTTVMVNRALLSEFDIPDRGMVIGKYNVFKDPEIGRTGLTDVIRQLFDGKTLTVTDLEAPLKSIRESYKTDGPPDVVAMF